MKDVSPRVLLIFLGTLARYLLNYRMSSSEPALMVLWRILEVSRYGSRIFFRSFENRE